MKKIFFGIFIVFILFCITAYATDLPINIHDIGRQGDGNNSTMSRFGVHLFTDDAKKINEAMADNVRRRQETAIYLFEHLSADNAIEPYEQIVNASVQSALFTEPVNFSRITIPSDTASIPSWLIITILLGCAAGGFLWALLSKKKEQTKGVH